MPKPLVTIAIPVYNGADFLAQAIDSALAQTWPAVEIIVVDDGSNDRGATWSVVERYGARIRSFRKPNGGVASALNFAIRQMKGAFFTWLSHDDLYEPEKTERQLAALPDLVEPRVVFSDWWTMDENGSRQRHHEVGGEDFGVFPLWAVLEGRINGCTVMIPRVCFDRCGDFLESLPTTQDYELWFRLALAFPFVHVAEPLISHRLHAGQGSRLRRHLDEASLLWMDMLDRTSPETMRAYSGSEIGFVSRVLTFLRRTSYAGAVAGYEQRLKMLQDRQSVSPDEQRKTRA